MIFEILAFICTTMNGIIMAMDSVYLGTLSILDIFISLMYLKITFWGIFTLISYKKNAVTMEDDNNE